MANYSTLYIGKKEVLSWRWEIPTSGDPLLNFIFLPVDRKIEVEHEEGDKLYYCTYETTVGEVKRRFNRYHFTIDEIDQIISKITGILIENVDIALMDYDTFYDYFAPPTEENDKEKLSAWEKLAEEKYAMKKVLEKHNLGLYPELRDIRTILDQTGDDELVYLDMTPILEYEDSPDKFDDINIISEGLDKEIKIERKYLEIAKVHFTTYDFDLVYIELVISLETALKSYLKEKYTKLSKTNNKNLNLESMVKNLSLIDLIKFVVVFLGKKELEDSLVNSLKKIYDKRNNIIHNNAKKFKRLEVVKAIEDIEKSLKIVDDLK